MNVEHKTLKVKLNFSSASIKANSFEPSLCQYNTPRTRRIYKTGRVDCDKEKYAILTRPFRTQLWLIAEVI